MGFASGGAAYGFDATGFGNNNLVFDRMFLFLAGIPFLLTLAGAVDFLLSSINEQG
jgi:hypothetical protein